MEIFFPRNAKILREIPWGVNLFGSTVIGTLIGWCQYYDICMKIESVEN